MPFALSSDPFARHHRRMRETTNDTPVEIHETARPEAFGTRLRRCLEARDLDPKFHYTTPRQAAAWLALHQKYSPFVNTAGGTDVYDRAFAWVAGHEAGQTVHLVSLACGGAGKELRLVQALRAAGHAVTATVSDISVPLVQAGHHTLTAEGGLTQVGALAVDLLDAQDLSAERFPCPAGARRLITCFGLMPNVPPLAIASRLAGLTQSGDVLLVGANLAPEEDYEAGTRAVLGGYDNDETRHWLGLLLADCGFAPGDGDIRFTVEPCPGLPELLQIVARYHLRQDRNIRLDGHRIGFNSGENLRLFFSNRYTPSRLKRLFERSGFNIAGEWISAEGNEGVMAGSLAQPLTSP